jgi:hypothetical protein
MLHRTAGLIGSLFVVSWAIAPAIWHLGKIEQRWTTHLERPSAGKARPRRAPARAPATLAL